MKYVFLYKLDGLGYMREYEIFVYKRLYYLLTFLIFSCKDEIMRKGLEYASKILLC